MTNDRLRAGHEASPDRAQPVTDRQAGGIAIRPAASGTRAVPLRAGILIGLGLGGFFDGIVLHQILQWHHMLSSWYPIDSIANLELNTRWDGIFHSATYVFVVLGVFILWRAGPRRPGAGSGTHLAGALLIGWGLFNTVEGVIDHQILGVHHVNETMPRAQWLAWDIGFLVWGGAMLVAGWWLVRAGGRTRVAP